MLVFAGAFGDALDFVEAHPECVNNRAYGATFQHQILFDLLMIAL